MISPCCSGGHEALSGHQSFVFILICLTEKAQVVVLTKLPDPMCHASTCMTVFSHVLFGYSFIANYLETALLILYLQENNHPLTPNIFCLPCKFRGEKQAESTSCLLPYAHMSTPKASRKARASHSATEQSTPKKKIPEQTPQRRKHTRG